MKPVAFDGTIETAYGEKLAKPIPYSGSFDAFETFDEVKEAKEELSNDEHVKAVNNGRKANARQKAMLEALNAAGIEKPTLADPKVQRATLVKTLLAAGKSQAEAEKLADSLLA